MKKIICLLCTIVVMMWGIFACTTEQADSVGTDVKEEKSGGGESSIKDGTVFKLTLDNQGAKTAGSAQIFLKYNVGYYLDKNGTKAITDETGAITIPVKTGFAFLGYNVKKDGSGQTIITSDGLLDLGAGYADFEADGTLYAQWGKVSSHNIIYQNLKGAANDNPTIFSESEDVTLKDLSLTGYVFGGWWTQSEGGERVSSWVVGAKTADVTLYARWTAITYTVSFNANGGSGSMPNQTFTYDVSQDLTSFALTAPEYKKFQNWNTKADGKGTPYNDGQRVLNLTEKAETIILYAQWMDKDAHRINYHNIKTANNSNNAATFKESQSVTLFNLSLNGWTFDGWYDASEDGTKIEGWGAGTKTADVDVWAYWTPLVYQITYKDEGDNTLTGTLTEPPTTHTYGTDTPLVSPIKKYYDFLGWHKQSNCADNSIDTIGAETILSDTTLYAKWALHNYKIIYHNTYDADNTNQQTFTINDSVTLSNITATGRTFDGWWTAENSGSQVTSWSAGAKKQDIEVWARWTPITYTITYKDMNDETFSGEHGANYPTEHIYATATSLVSPTRSGWTFIGWYDTAECDGTKLTSLGAEDYTNNITLYAKWEIGYECSAAELSSLLSTLSSVNNPYKIIITDEDPDLSLIKSALQSNSSIEVNLDLSRCSDLLLISDLQNCANLVGITIPDCVLSISESAFSGCSGLTSLTIPDSVTSIGDSAFTGCSGLKSLVIGSGITTIQKGLLSGLSSLESITIPFVGDRPHTSEDTNQYPFGYIFGTSSYDGGTATQQYYQIGSSTSSTTHTIYYIPTSLKCVTITGSSYIQKGAFQKCSGLTSVTIPNGVTNIGDSAFSDCNGLTGSLTIPNGVTSIGNSAFSGCRSLTGSLTIPNGVTSIGNSAFSGCRSLTGSLTIPDGVTSIGDYAFSDCNGLTGNLTIPNRVTSIGRGVFSGCSGLTGSLMIPDGVTSIGERSFNNCSGLTGSLTIPDGVTSIGDHAFNNCSGLTGSLTIPDGVTSIGDYAFSDCNGLTGNLTIPNRVTSIGERSFNNCSGLTGSLTIPDGVTNIGRSAFSGCSGLTGSLMIPNRVRSIGGNAFRNCSGLTSVTIPNSVTTISFYAFTGCIGLMSITVDAENSKYDSRDNCNAIIETSSNRLIVGCKNTVIPNSVTSIYGAFSDFSNLTNVMIPDSVTNIDGSAFSGCSGLTNVTIPGGVTSISSNAFYNCSGLTILNVKATTPPSFGTYMLYGCSALTTIYVPTNSVDAYKAADGWSEYDSIIVAGTF